MMYMVDAVGKCGCCMLVSVLCWLRHYPKAEDEQLLWQMLQAHRCEAAGKHDCARRCNVHATMCASNCALDKAAAQVLQLILNEKLSNAATCLEVADDLQTWCMGHT